MCIHFCECPGDSTLYFWFSQARTPEPRVKQSDGKCLEGGADVWMRFIIAFWNYFFLKLLLLLLRDLLLLFETFLLNLWPQTQRQNLSNVLWEKQAVHLRPLKLEIYYSSSTRSLKSFFFLKKNFFFYLQQILSAWATPDP